MQKNYMCTENSDCCYLPIIDIYWKRISIHDVIKQVRSCGYSAMRLKKKNLWKAHAPWVAWSFCGQDGLWGSAVAPVVTGKKGG